MASFVLLETTTNKYSNAFAGGKQNRYQNGSFYIISCDILRLSNHGKYNLLFIFFETSSYKQPLYTCFVIKCYFIINHLLCAFAQIFSHYLILLFERKLSQVVWSSTMLDYIVGKKIKTNNEYTWMVVRIHETINYMVSR